MLGTDGLVRRPRRDCGERAASIGSPGGDSKPSGVAHFLVPASHRWDDIGRYRKTCSRSGRGRTRSPGASIAGSSRRDLLTRPAVAARPCEVLAKALAGRRRATPEEAEGLRRGRPHRLLLAPAVNRVRARRDPDRRRDAVRRRRARSTSTRFRGALHAPRGARLRRRSSSPGRPARRRRSPTTSGSSSGAPAVDAVGDRATVVAGTGTYSTAHSVHLTGARARARRRRRSSSSRRTTTSRRRAGSSPTSAAIAARPATGRSSSTTSPAAS